MKQFIWTSHYWYNNKVKSLVAAAEVVIVDVASVWEA